MPAPKLSTWRRLALAAWGPPRDPTAYGTLEVDVEAALAFLTTLVERTGVKVTLTHLVGKAIAVAIAEVPEVNVFVSRSRLVARRTVDVFFQVAFFGEEDEGANAQATNGTSPRSDLSGLKIARADQRPLHEIARELGAGALAIRDGSDGATTSKARALARMPTPLIGPAIRMGGFLSYDLGLDLSVFGVPFDAYGSVMITNVGVFGLPVAMAPLSELSRVPILLAIGEVRPAAAVVDGAVAVRKVVTIGVSFDHRVMDGFHAGRLGKRFLAILKDPERELGFPSSGG